jgi:DnaJ-class molecular chaperone
MDFYKTLGLQSNATQQEVKMAFRKKAMECHPDRCFEADANQRFLDIKEAYDALTDPSYKPSRSRNTTQAKPTQRRNTSSGSTAGNWTKDAPPPTHDLWGKPYNTSREFIDSAKYEQEETPKRRVFVAQKRIPEVNLWKSMESEDDSYIKKYWEEYDRLKITMAYEEPQCFFDALDEWMRNYKKS